MPARFLPLALLLVFVCASFEVQAQTAPPPSAAGADSPLFAAEIRTGPNWDTAKPANQQAYFQEHSANLQRLRESGNLVFGARYSDKGLVVLKASTEAEARAMMQQDPSIQHGVFAFELHEFRVFYGGAVQPRPRR